MFSRRVKDVMEGRKLFTAPPGMTVSEAAKQMAERKIGAVLAVDQGDLVGIFTERDAVFRVIAKDLDPRATRLADVMTFSPTTIAADESFGFALMLLHQNGFRHLPVIENGRLVGIVSARNALDPDLEEFAAEARRREYFLHKRT